MLVNEHQHVYRGPCLFHLFFLILFVKKISTKLITCIFYVCQMEFLFMQWFSFLLVGYFFFNFFSQCSLLSFSHPPFRCIHGLSCAGAVKNAKKKGRMSLNFSRNCYEGTFRASTFWPQARGLSLGDDRLFRCGLFLSRNLTSYF